MTEGTYYRFGGKLVNAGCEMLPNGNDIEYIVIEKIELKASHDMGGRKESNVWVATFAKNPYTTLPMILNATNRKRIAKMFWETIVSDGKPCYGRIDLLKNIPVRLTKEKCRDVQDGGETYGLRISRTPATIPAKEKLTEEHKNFGKCVDALKSGRTIDELKAKYEISASVEKSLMEKSSK